MSELLASPSETKAAEPESDAEIVMERRTIAVTLEQATAFYALMCEFGLDTMMDRVAEMRQPQVNGVVVMDAKEQAAAMKPPEPTEEEKAEALAVSINMAHIIREIGKKGGLIRLGAIVLNCTEDEAKKKDAAELTEDLLPFLRASIGPLQTLLGFVGALA